jgi:hypothetical protein
VARLPFPQVSAGVLPRSGSSLPTGGRRELHAGAACLRQTDGDRLLRGARAVLAFANVLHFLSHEFPRLGRGAFALASVAAGSFNGLSVRHGIASCTPAVHKANQKLQMKT